jgi:RHS repeat-associated protein
VLETGMAEKTVAQVAMAELGTSATHAADSCRVYNYYVGANNASACSELPSAWPQGSYTDNNGNVAGYYYNDIMNSGLSHTASYNYDAVNRLSSAAASYNYQGMKPLSSAAATGNFAYGQTYSYDPYGNVDCAASPAENKCIGLSYSPTTNHITTSGYTYDAAGNLTTDGTYTYRWDAEARLAKVINGAGTAISTNTYNALGQRVRDVTASSTTDEAYGADGALLWRYTGNSSDPNQRAFVPFNGRILAEYYGGSSPGTIFDHPDEIGSVTASTLYNGSACQERLYYPFGELWTGAGSCGMHQEFAQLPDYDVETDHYNTPNRHYNPTGRWLTPDPLGGHLEDPQTLNKYAYVRNSPTTLTDPSGLCPNSAEQCSGGDPGPQCSDTTPCGVAKRLPCTEEPGKELCEGQAAAQDLPPPPQPPALTGFYPSPKPTCPQVTKAPTKPRPVTRLGHPTPLHSIIMRITELFQALLLAPNVQVVSTPLPDTLMSVVVRAARQFKPRQQLPAPRILQISAQISQPEISRTLCQPVHDRRGPIGQNVVAGRPAIHPRFEANDLSRNSRAQAQRNAARPRRLGLPHPKAPALRMPIASRPLPTANLEPIKPYRSPQRGVK